MASQLSTFSSLPQPCGAYRWELPTLRLTWGHVPTQKSTTHYYRLAQPLIRVNKQGGVIAYPFKGLTTGKQLNRIFMGRAFGGCVKPHPLYSMVYDSRGWRLSRHQAHDAAGLPLIAILNRNCYAFEARC